MVVDAETETGLTIIHECLQFTIESMVIDSLLYMMLIFGKAQMTCTELLGGAGMVILVPFSSKPSLIYSSSQNFQ